jgi:hypothetical protein
VQGRDTEWREEGEDRDATAKGGDRGGRDGTEETVEKVK